MKNASKLVLNKVGVTTKESENMNAFMNIRKKSILDNNNAVIQNLEICSKIQIPKNFNFLIKITLKFVLLEI